MGNIYDLLQSCGFLGVDCWWKLVILAAATLLISFGFVGAFITMGAGR